MKNSIEQVKSVLDVNFSARCTLDHKITMIAASELNNGDFLVCNDEADAASAIKDAGGFALMTIQKEVKKGNRWIADGEKTLHIVTRDFFEKFTATETLKGFRRAGGIETAKKSYTAHGYLVTSLLSTDPTRKTRARRTFKIID